MGLTRRIHCEIWDDPWFDGLSAQDKLLYLYLWTTARCDQIGLLTYPVHRIAVEVSLRREEVLKGLQRLSPKVVWDEDLSCVWVRAFIARQGGDKGRYRIAVVNRLRELVEQRHPILDKVSVRYRELTEEAGYTIDRVSEDCDSVSREPDTVPISVSVSESVSASEKDSVPKGVREVVEDYNAVAAKAGCVECRYAAEAVRLVKKRLRQGHTRDELKAIWSYLASSDWHCGKVRKNGRQSWRASLHWALDKHFSDMLDKSLDTKAEADTERPQTWTDMSVRNSNDGLPCQLFSDDYNRELLTVILDRCDAGDEIARQQYAKLTDFQKSLLERVPS